jgi:hypothetical protein
MGDFLVVYVWFGQQRERLGPTLAQPRDFEQEQTEIHREGKTLSKLRSFFE